MGTAVLTLGETMAVLYPKRPVGLDRAPSVLLAIAGTESNTAIGLARLGCGTRFISRVGDDPFGRRIRATLEAEGVDAQFLLTDRSAPTGVFFREALPDGQRRVYYYRKGSAASRLAPQDLPREALAGVKIVHLTGITPALSGSCAATVLRAIELAREAGALVSFDPNFRPQLWTAAACRVALVPLLRQTDILLLGDEDARAVLEAEDDAALGRAAALGIRTVVLRQAAGALALVDGRRFVVRGRRARRIVDPVGAGDGFNAGFLAGRLRGYAMEESLALGAEIGTRVIEHLGDYAGYPTGDDASKARHGPRGVDRPSADLPKARVGPSIRRSAAAPRRPQDR